MNDRFTIFVPANRSKLLIGAALLLVGIVLLDWWTPRVSVGLLYLFPIAIVGASCSRVTVAGAALLCAGLAEAFSNLSPSEAGIRFVLNGVGFVGLGLFVSELQQKRNLVSGHLEAMKAEIDLRKDVEEQLQLLVDSSPAAIVTVDAKGTIVLANQAAHELLAPDAEPLKGRPIGAYLPTLEGAVHTLPLRTVRTTLQCGGRRSNGEAFMAGVWVSTYTGLAGPHVAAVVVDLSEEFRDREDLNLDRMLKSSRVLVDAMAHEIRNLCSAAAVLQRNLSGSPALSDNEDFRALSSLIQSLERIAAVRVAVAGSGAAAVELTSVLEELRILLEGAFRESGIEISWEIESGLPMVWANRYDLIQVFLNLARNSQKAMGTSETKELRISAMSKEKRVVIRFEDTGSGITHPELLFRPFRPGSDSTGLGLYVSRSLLRSFGGDLHYEPRSQPAGCCFAITVPMVTSRVEAPPRV